MRIGKKKIKLLTSIFLAFQSCYLCCASERRWGLDDFFLVETPLEMGLVSQYTGHFFQLKLLAFQATLVEGVVELTWETAAETTLSGYEIERSQDGGKFKKIAWVEAFGKAEGADYLYVDDPGEFKNRFRYRLKFVYKNKSFEYSEIRVARLPKILPRWD